MKFSEHLTNKVLSLEGFQSPRQKDNSQDLAHDQFKRSRFWLLIITGGENEVLRMIVQLVIIYGRREMKRPEEIHRGKHSM